MEINFKFRIFIIIQCFSIIVSETILQNKLPEKLSELKTKFPYMVSIRRTELEELEFDYHICGGTLIDERRVVTAAHCMFDKFGNLLGMPNSFTIVAGTFYYNIKDGREIIRTSKKIYLYPKFQIDNLYHDVAVIILNDTIHLNGQSTRGVSLAENRFPEGTNCTISGWGKLGDSDYDKTFLPSLKDMIPIWSEEECRAYYNTINYIIISSQICAGQKYSESNVCEGDDGSVLICNNYFYGILSKRFQCENQNAPGIYTDVTNYLEFIKSPENFNVSTNNTSSYAKRTLPIQTFQGVVLFAKFLITLTLIY